MKIVKVLLYAMLAALLTVSLGFAAEKSFKAKLTGKEESTGVKTKAKGEAEFKLSKDSKEMTYKLEVKNIENVTAAHIHEGKKGMEGPPVVTLFGGKKEGKFKGVLSQGMITDKDLSGSLQGKTVEQLVNLIKEGNAYVNVHTEAHPNGEIRGQIK